MSDLSNDIKMVAVCLIAILFGAAYARFTGFIGKKVRIVRKFLNVIKILIQAVCRIDLRK